MNYLIHVIFGLRVQLEMHLFRDNQHRGNGCNPCAQVVKGGVIFYLLSNHRAG